MFTGNGIRAGSHAYMSACAETTIVSRAIILRELQLNYIVKCEGCMCAKTGAWTYSFTLLTREWETWPELFNN